MNRPANSRIGTAATDVARHRIINVCVRGFGILGKQYRRAHDLTRLTIAALRHVNLDPGLLQRMAEIIRETFDGGDFFAGDIRDALDARTDRFAIEVNGAGATLRHSTTVLGSGQTERFAQNPEQGRTRFNVDVNRLPVNLQSNHADTPFELSDIRILRMNHGSDAYAAALLFRGMLCMLGPLFA